MKGIMNAALFCILFCCFTATCALYNQCSNGRKFANIEQNVEVSGCRKTYCRLKKRTSAAVTFKFTPEQSVKSLTNSVSADIAGIPFPFIGFDGTNGCTSIYESDGQTKANCSLQAGKEYVYKNSINVLPIYPSIKLVVRWALDSPGGQLMCFEVPARIVN